MLTATSNEDRAKIQRLKDRLGSNLRVSAKPLPAGDYVFEAHGKVCGIEVKWSQGDLLESLKVVGENSGTRLGVEVRKLIAQVDIPILVCPPLRARGDGKLLRDYRNANGDEATGWEYSGVKGILTDVALYGVIIDEWDGDIAERLAQLYYVISKKEHSWIQQRGRPEFISLEPAYSEAVWALSAIDKVGPDRAMALLKHFGSLRGVMNADAKALQKVPGVGPLVAASITKIANWEAP